MADDAESEIAPQVVREAVASIEAGGSAAAKSMIHAVEAGGDEEKALVLLAECAATSPLVATQLLDAGCVRSLLPHLDPARSSKRSTELVLRVFSALSTQPNTTERMLKDGLLPPLLSLTHTASDAIGMRIAALLHNLADTPANRFRLVHERTLTVLTHMLVNPAGSGSLKEHGLQAAASIAGFPTEELSFPQLLGRLCESKLPGQQREAMACLAIIADKTPEHRARLGQVPDIARGLVCAAGSSDAKCSSEAHELLDLFGVRQNS
ncbi:hypothetical protein AB1Y20_020434 [Prymnesium parvum]|uniref:Protein HGH1 homolog n=1 Tax=Prymnesium parvum TaxID=97485 RepID=A0AB34JY34_PRYPA